MRCGNCKAEHDSVNEVRECYGVKVQQGNSVWPASAWQVVYADGLAKERVLPDGYIAKTVDELAAMDRDQIDSTIKFLKGLAKKPSATGVHHYTLPAARYAIQDDDGVWRFYEVNKPTEGRWAGYTFIKRLRGSPGQYQKDQMAPADRYRVLSIIEANQKEAMINYGLQSGVCGKCSSPLTDPQSLARGIGPVCLGKMGW